MMTSPRLDMAGSSNLNGIADDLDIQNGTSPDCNTNAIPDECDICPPEMTSTVGMRLRLADVRGRGAGVVIIGGDDMTDHGSVSEKGGPQDGWLYIQRALENIAPLVTRLGNDGSIAALGSAPSQANCCDAGAAIGVAANAAGLTASFHNGEAAINQFFADLATGNVNPAIIWTAGTEAINNLDLAEGQALTNNAIAIANFVNSGGGLMSHGSGNAAYGWLKTRSWPPSTLRTPSRASTSPSPGPTRATADSSSRSCASAGRVWNRR